MFKLEIETGNDAMQTADDVARALDGIAWSLYEGCREDSIRDLNGNTVGRWTLELED